MEKITERGNRRFVINIVRGGRAPESAMLDMLADIEAWLRMALPHYNESFSLKTKAQGIRENVKAAYVLTQQFFQDCEDQGIGIPNSALVRKSNIEKAIEG